MKYKGYEIKKSPHNDCGNWEVTIGGQRLVGSLKWCKWTVELVTREMKERMRKCGI